MTAIATYLTLRALIDELARCGMQIACATPGSRNTPIALSLANEPRIVTHSLIDERAAGFFALGAAKASGRPVAVTCTSGTAAANLLPAVIEAHEAGVPLLVLTADRPPELRDVGAGQTIDQIKLYGDAVKWFCEVGLPESSAAQLRWIRSLACRAYWTAAAGFPGPVHLNLPLREPLALAEPLPASEPGGGGRPGARPWVTQRTPTHLPATVAPERNAQANAVRTVIVAGETPNGHELGAQLAALAAELQIPLLADPRSGARRGGAAIAHYDLLLRHPQTATALRPERVIRVGDLPTSKPLRTWLATLTQADQITLGDETRWPDPTADVGARWIGSPAEQLAMLAQSHSHNQPPGSRSSQATEAPDGGGWLARWRATDARVSAAIREPLAASGLSEPVVAQILSQQLTASADLFVAASMPIRDVELLFAACDDQPRVLANRGANGIDGTVSTAFGTAAVAQLPGTVAPAQHAAAAAAAAQSERQVVLLTGDVTLTHDLGGLLCASRNGLKLTIVLLNNGGGSIFDFLPVARSTAADQFERLIATPPGIAFDQAAALFGLNYAQPSSVAEFTAALTQALDAQVSTIIEVRGDRPDNRQLHRDLEVAALDALATPFL